MNWLHMTNTETRGTSTFPDEPGVKEWYEAHGWKVTDPPKDGPTGNPPDVDPEVKWVTMYNPKTQVSHGFPNNPEAIAGAKESGWQVPKLNSPQEKPEMKATPKKAAQADDKKGDA
jgi:hypothetical protein